MAQTPKRPGGTKKKSPKKRLQTGLAAAAIVLLAAGCGVGGYFMLRRPATAPEVPQETLPVETLATEAPAEVDRHYTLGAPIGFEPGLTGKAKVLLDRLQKRRTEGYATPRQIRALEQRGFRNVGNWAFQEANAMISRIANNKWRVPFDVDPYTYVPRMAVQPHMAGFDDIA